MKTLDIIIRTHDKSNISKFPRFISVSKKELIEGCITSLINSANQCKNKINIIVLDDHSSQEFLNNLQSILKTSRHSTKVISLEEGGKNQSALQQFEYCKNSTADLIYSVEDDYLHCTEAIQEMLFTYDYLKSYYHLQKELCVFPFDSPEDYEYTFVVPGRLFRTPTRHWKEGIWTTFTMMTTPKVFRDYWDVFEKLASQYTPWNGTDEIKELVHEGNTISNIWEHHVTRVNPVPSLALHIQFEKQRDPHIDHLNWWDKYSKIKKSILFYQ